MEYPNKVYVLSEFKLYLPLINAYNNGHFFHLNQNCLQYRIVNAFCATLIHILLPVYVILGIWYLIENDADLEKFAVTSPVLISLLQVELMFIAVMIQTRSINEVINKLQQVFEKRK